MGFRPYLNGTRKTPPPIQVGDGRGSTSNGTRSGNNESDGIEEDPRCCENTWKNLPRKRCESGSPSVYLRYTHDTESYWPADMTTGDYTSEDSTNSGACG